MILSVSGKRKLDGLNGVPFQYYLDHETLAPVDFVITGGIFSVHFNNEADTAGEGNDFYTVKAPILTLGYGLRHSKDSTILAMPVSSLIPTLPVAGTQQGKVEIFQFVELPAQCPLWVGISYKGQSKADDYLHYQILLACEELADKDVSRGDRAFR